jgi:hypothetical protein
MEFIGLINSGMIETTDYFIDYINVGYTQQFFFTFKLENGLGVKNYLSILFPFALTNPLSDLSSIDVKFFFYYLINIDLDKV